MYNSYIYVAYAGLDPGQETLDYFPVVMLASLLFAVTLMSKLAVVIHFSSTILFQNSNVKLGGVPREI